MTNLLSNAVKFTPAGGQVQVTAEAAAGWAVVCVTDTGIGVPDADQKDVFTRFFRASNATKRPSPVPVWAWPSPRRSSPVMAVTWSFIRGRERGPRSRCGSRWRDPSRPPDPPTTKPPTTKPPTTKPPTTNPPTTKPPDTVPPPRPERGHEAPTRGRPGSGGLR